MNQSNPKDNITVTPIMFSSHKWAGVADGFLKVIVKHVNFDAMEEIIRIAQTSRVDECEDRSALVTQVDIMFDEDDLIEGSDASDSASGDGDPLIGWVSVQTKGKGSVFTFFSHSFIMYFICATGQNSSHSCDTALPRNSGLKVGQQDPGRRRDACSQDLSHFRDPQSLHSQISCDCLHSPAACLPEQASIGCPNSLTPPSCAQRPYNHFSSPFHSQSQVGHLCSPVPHWPGETHGGTVSSPSCSHSWSPHDYP